MFPPLLDVGEEADQSNVTLLASSTSMETVELKECNYMGLSDCSSVDSSVVSTVSDKTKISMNLKATELRLGLPGSQSPERDSKPRLSSTQLDEKPFFPLHPSSDVHYTPTQKAVASGNKRGFSDAMDGFAEVKKLPQVNEIGLFFSLLLSLLSPLQGKCISKAEVNAMLSPRPSPSLGLKTGSALDNLGTQPAKVMDVAPSKVVQEWPHAANETRPTHNGPENNNSSAPAPK